MSIGLKASKSIININTNNSLQIPPKQELKKSLVIRKINPSNPKELQSVSDAVFTSFNNPNNFLNQYANNNKISVGKLYTKNEEMLLNEKMNICDLSSTLFTKTKTKMYELKKKKLNSSYASSSNIENNTRRKVNINEIFNRYKNLKEYNKINNLNNNDYCVKNKKIKKLLLLQEKIINNKKIKEERDLKIEKKLLNKLNTNNSMSLIFNSNKINDIKTKLSSKLNINNKKNNKIINNSQISDNKWVKNLGDVTNCNNDRHRNYSYLSNDQIENEEMEKYIYENIKYYNQNYNYNANNLKFLSNSIKKQLNNYIRFDKKFNSDKYRKSLNSSLIDLNVKGKDLLQCEIDNYHNLRSNNRCRIRIFNKYGKFGKFIDDNGKFNSGISKGDIKKFQEDFGDITFYNVNEEDSLKGVNTINNSIKLHEGFN